MSNSDIRQTMPHIAEIVDEYAAEFGRESFRVTFAQENGRSIGRESERGFPIERMQFYSENKEKTWLLKK